MLDPLAEDYVAFSPYNYTLNNPIRNIDPDGRSSEDCCGTGFATANNANQQAAKGNNFYAGLLDVLAGTDPLYSAYTQVKALFSAESKADVGRALDPTGLSSLPTTVKAAANGDGRAQGQLTGGVILAAVTRKVVKAKGGSSTNNRGAKLPVGKPGTPMEINTPNTPTTILGREFSGHSLDQMQARGVISPTAVDDVIRNPSSSTPGNTPNTTVHQRDNLRVIVNEKGKVVTVMKKSKKSKK